MHKLKVSLVLIITTLLITACDSNNLESINTEDLKSRTVEHSPEAIKEDVINGDEVKSGKVIEIPINITYNNKNEVKAVEIKEESTLQQKLQKIVDVISYECFSSLPMKVKVYAESDKARVDLIEPSDVQKSRASWKEDYLSENIKDETINTIVTNLIQDQYKGEWIDTVQLYYNDEVIQLD